MVMQQIRSRWSSEVVVTGGVLVFGAMTAASGYVQDLAVLSVIMLVGGAAWILFISLFNVLILNRTPDWVRARVLAVSMLVFQGAMAAGSAAWGALAVKTGLHTALIWAGVGTMVSTASGLFLKLPEAAVDLTPWIHWRLPTIVNQNEGIADSGPIIVTVDYEVDEKNVSAFIKAINHFGRIRRRDGAYRWGIYQDLEKPSRYLEVFLVDSWAEHLRQHERSTHADREITERVQNFVRGEPVTRHLVYASEDAAEPATEHNQSS